MAVNRINQEKFKEALKGTAGVQSDIAAKLGVDRSAVTHFLNKHPKMRELLEQERQKLIDVAENVYKEALSLQTKDTREKRLPTQVKRDNMRLKLKAAERVVGTLGKGRGWVPREEREHSGEIAHNFEAVKINVIMPKNNVEKKETQAPNPKPKEGKSNQEKKVGDSPNPKKET